MFTGIRSLMGGLQRTEAAKGTRTGTAGAAGPRTQLGANAVVGVDLDYAILGTGHSMLMVSASGTAVVLA